MKSPAEKPYNRIAFFPGQESVLRGLRLTLAMRLALLYALICGLWILLSGRAVAAVVKDPADLTLVQTYKGWLFVAATSLLLFVYLVYENKRRQATERDYRNIFEHAVEGIFQSTLEGRFISVNPAMARIYGYDSPEEMIAAISDIDRLSAGRIDVREYKSQRPQFSGYALVAVGLWVMREALKVGVPAVRTVPEEGGGGRRRGWL